MQIVVVKTEVNLVLADVEMQATTPLCLFTLANDRSVFTGHVVGEIYPEFERP